VGRALHVYALVLGLRWWSEALHSSGGAACCTFIPRYMCRRRDMGWGGGICCVYVCVFIIWAFLLITYFSPVVFMPNYTRHKNCRLWRFLLFVLVPSYTKKKAGFTRKQSVYHAYTFKRNCRFSYCAVGRFFCRNRQPITSKVSVRKFESRYRQFLTPNKSAVSDSLNRRSMQSQSPVPCSSNCRFRQY
jgi:hypothetical protein